MFTIGGPQYSDYVNTRFIKGSADVVQTPIKKNLLKLPHHLATVGQASPQIKLPQVTITKLQDACVAVKRAFQNGVYRGTRVYVL